MNILFILTLLTLLIVISIIVFIKKNDNKVLLKLKYLDDDLMKLLDKNNFFNENPEKIITKGVSDIKIILDKIKLNEDEWNNLFEQKYSNVLNSYLLKDREFYYKYKSGRNLFTNHLTKMIENFLTNFERSQINDLDLTNNPFYKKFFTGYYKPSFQALNLQEINSDINKVEPLISLDNEFLSLCNKDNFFTNQNEINKSKDDEVLVSLIQKIKENYLSWKLEYDKLYSNIHKLSNDNRSYLITRNFFSTSLISDLENFIINRNQFSQTKYHINYLHSEFMRLPTSHDYKYFNEVRNNFYNFKKI